MQLFQVSEITAVIFDLDGVLIDSEPLHYAVLNRVLVQEGHVLEEEDYNKFIGTTLRHVMTSLVKQFGLPRSVEEYEIAYKEELLLALKDPIEPTQGARQLVAQIRTHDLKLAVA